jgi:branched-subunit amino acid transport protein
MTAWIVIVSVGVGTFIFRSVLFVVVGDRALPAWTDRPLSYVGPAAIAALVGGSMLIEQGRFAPAPGGDLIAVVATFVFVQRTRNIALGLVLGLAVLWCLAVVGYAG